MSTDFDSLFSQYAPQLGGAATPMPATAPAPPRSAMDTIRDLAPVVLSAFTAMKDPAAAGALMQGVARGRELARARTIQAEDRELERRQMAARYAQQVAADAQQFDNLEEHQQYLSFAEKVGQAYGIQPGQLTTSIAFPKTKVAAKKQKEAQARLAALESSAGYKDIIGTPHESGLAVTMPDGERLTVAQLRERSGLALYDQAGAQLTPPAPAAKPSNLTDYEGFLARYAKGKGKAVADLTAQDELEARKLWGQADDRPLKTDPALDELRRQGIELSNELKRSQIANKSTAGLPALVQRRVDALTRGFDGQQAVKRAVVLGEAASFVNSLKADTQNPGDDQALVYAFAKAMDPDSAVREGEYNTIQKYALPDLTRFGINVQRFFNSRGFLTPEARKNLKATIQQKFNANRVQYDNLRRSYAERINRATGSTDGADYLTDYAGGFPGGTPESDLGRGTGAPAGAPARKIGRFEVTVRGGK